MSTSDKRAARSHRERWERTGGRLTQVSRALGEVLFPAHPTWLSVVKAFCFFLVVSAVLSILFLAIVRPKYTATAVIGPTQEQFAMTPSNQLDRNALSILSGGGILSAPRVITPYDAFLKTMQTREVASRLFADPYIREGLFPSVWDRTTKSWKPTFNAWSLIAGPLYWITRRAYPRNPTVDNVEYILKTSLNLSLIERGPMYTMAYSATNRVFATEFVRRVFSTTDTVVKEKNRAQVLQRLRALKARMNSLDVVEYRSEFVNLVMDQEKQLMVLQGNTDFAASMIVAPSAPDYPDSPRVFVTILVFMGFAFFLGASVLVFIYRDKISARIRPVTTND